MKIVFLCSSLEPGCDGVGDYTRLLAAEIIRQGNFSAVISLNDKYISDEFNDIQQSEGTNLPVLRLPESWPVNVRLKLAKKYIDDFNPDWLSLQFVIFGFHRKGLPFGLGSKLAFLGKSRRWHIMLHELWIGMEKHSSKRHSLLGGIQRRLIKSLIATLNPAVIHTHTSLYRQQLAELGFIAQHLPLFGNIPRFHIDDGLNSMPSSKNGKSINLVIFGNIFPGAPIDDFANDAANYSAKTGVEIYLTIMGRGGSEHEHWAGKWAAAGLTVNNLGEQPVNNISKVLGTATIGISTTPVELIEKSGSVAAMLEHGLPVICVPFPWQSKSFKNLKTLPGIISYQKGNLESIFAGGFDTPEMNGVSVIAHQLVNVLLNSA